MSPTNTGNAASADKAGAARSEKNGKPKTHKWKGLTLKLPPEAPMSLVWSFYDVQATQKDGDDADALFGALGMLEGVLGTDQLSLVRQTQIESGASAAEGSEDLMQLLQAILKKYGMGMGESKASTQS